MLLKIATHGETYLTFIPKARVKMINNQRGAQRPEVYNHSRIQQVQLE